LIVVLAALVWQLDKAGAWVLASGLARYAFVAAGWALPYMRRSLPPSMRRKTICVIQILALCAVLMPMIQPPWSALLAAAALTALCYSFAVDTIWLYRHRTTPSE
jgi:phosphatidylglycerophosphate synthase